MKLKTTRIILLAITYVLFHIMYSDIISPLFAYQGFISQPLNFSQLLIHIVILLFLLSMQYFMSNPFYLLVYNIYLILILFGQSVYSMNTETNHLFFLLVIPLLLLALLDLFDKNNFKLRRKQFDINNKFFYIFAIALSIIIIGPFLRNIGSINLSNLLFLEIYDTRLNNEVEYGVIINYMYSAVARVFFPFLLIFFMVKKRYFLSFIIFSFIILLFLLNGAVKSVVVGALMSIYFLFFKYKIKNLMFIVTMLLLFISGIVSFKVYDSMLIADYLRRVMYLPAQLFDVYYDFFNSNYTYYTHTNFMEILGSENEYGRITSFIGESVLGKENMVANVGLFVEGYISSGVIGVVIASVIFIFIIFLLKSLDFKHYYFGLVFTYLYVLNTSFIETLWITHGLLFLVVFGYFFIPTNEYKNIEENN